MRLAVTVPGARYGAWPRHLAAALPDWDISYDPEIATPETIDAVLVWRPKPGWCARFPNLKVIQSFGAGVDHVLSDPHLPHVPLVRLIDPYMTRSMAEFVTFQVLRLHLGDGNYRRQQNRRAWKDHVPPVAPDRRVGILGFGELGGAVADHLLRLDFQVAAWSRTAKSHPQVTCFAGPAELPELLARSEILICLLPLSPDTHGILSAETFAQLPMGAGLINVARGRHLVEADLLAALEQGRIGDAVLDVFAEEPLPADHPFWAHERIVVTPHVAALTNPLSASKVIAANLRAVLAGEKVAGLVDPSVGY
jgi:glyoxylate/hydroxypyruvate reductase A